MSTYKLTYFGFPARAFATRVALRAAGIAFEASPALWLTLLECPRGTATRSSRESLTTQLA